MPQAAQPGRREVETIKSQLSELHLATVYGIEGLSRYGEEDKEEWMDLFQTALEELDKPIRPETGGFKLSSSGEEKVLAKEYLISDGEKRETVVEGLEELSAFAERLRDEGLESEDGSVPKEQVEEKIELAKRVRDILEESKPS